MVHAPCSNDKQEPKARQTTLNRGSRFINEHSATQPDLISPANQRLIFAHTFTNQQRRKMLLLHDTSDLQTNTVSWISEGPKQPFELHTAIARWGLPANESLAMCTDTWKQHVEPGSGQLSYILDYSGGTDAKDHSETTLMWCEFES